MEAKVVICINEKFYIPVYTYHQDCDKCDRGPRMSCRGEVNGISCWEGVGTWSGPNGYMYWKEVTDGT